MSLFQQPDGGAIRGQATYQAAGGDAVMFVCVHVSVCVLGFIETEIEQQGMTVFVYIIH